MRTGWDWNESSIQFNGAPGMTFDQNSRTLGLNSTSTNIPNILTMGTLTVGAMTAGTTVDFNNANLAVFQTCPSISRIRPNVDS